MLSQARDNDENAILDLIESNENVRYLVELIGLQKLANFYHAKPEYFDLISSPDTGSALITGLKKEFYTFDQLEYMLHQYGKRNANIIINTESLSLMEQGKITFSQLESLLYSSLNLDINPFICLKGNENRTKEMIAIEIEMRTNDREAENPPLFQKLKVPNSELKSFILSKRVGSRCLSSSDLSNIFWSLPALDTLDFQPWVPSYPCLHDISLALMNYLLINPDFKLIASYPECWTSIYQKAQLLAFCKKDYNVASYLKDQNVDWLHIEYMTNEQLKHFCYFMTDTRRPILTTLNLNLLQIVNNFENVKKKVNKIAHCLQQSPQYLLLSNFTCWDPRLFHHATESPATAKTNSDNSTKIHSP